MVIELKKLAFAFQGFENEGGSEEEPKETIEEVEGDDDFEFGTDDAQ